MYLLKSCIGNIHGLKLNKTDTSLETYWLNKPKNLRFECLSQMNKIEWNIYSINV